MLPFPPYPASVARHKRQCHRDFLGALWVAVNRRSYSSEKVDLRRAAIDEQCAGAGLVDNQVVPSQAVAMQ